MHGSPALPLALALLALPGCGAAEARAGPSLPVVESPASEPVAIGRQAVELIGNGQVAVERILTAIDAAQLTVHAEIYEFDRREIRDALLGALRRGVSVVVVGDMTVALNATTFATLRAAGATVLGFPDGPMQIDHVKLLLVDGRLAIFGGMNWGRGSYLNHDFDVVLSGAAVDKLESIFAADEVRSGRATAGPAPVAPDVPGLRLLTSYPEDQVRPAVLEAIEGARRYVFVEMYVLTDGQVMASLGRAAGRGVDAWILFDPNQDLNRAAAIRLRAAGVNVRFYRTSGEKLHAKAMVVDGHTLVVGSANWTSSGFTRNHELDAVIASDHLAAQALSRMEADWRASG